MKDEKVEAVSGEKEESAASREKRPVQDVSQKQDAENASAETVPDAKEGSDEEEPEPEETIIEENSGTEEAGEEPETTEDAGEESEEKEMTEEPGEQTAEDSEEEEPAEEAEEEKRLADMTRTVQVSIEQIMARMEQTSPATQEATVSESAEESEETETEEPVTAADLVRGGLLGILRWVLLVLCFVAVIAGVGVAFLYRNATEDLLPVFSVTFDGQDIPPASYEWHVPVVSNLLRRGYRETLQEEPYVLPLSVGSVSPTLTVSPSGYEASLTVTQGEREIFSGSLAEFRNFNFDTANAQYLAELVLCSGSRQYAGSAEVTGSQTYRFAFEIHLRPNVRVSTQSITQGNVLSVRVDTTSDGNPPELMTDFENTGFVKAKTGWVAYLPIPFDTAPGTTQLTVRTRTYEETLGLRIKPADWQEKDYSSSSRFTSPYIGSDNTPGAVTSLLNTAEEPIHWADEGFVEPFTRDYDVVLGYGTTEYAGRTASQRKQGTGEGRSCTNAVISCRKGEELLCPAAGKVILARELDDTAGCTVVVDHGAGLKSIFYRLSSLDVQKGDQVAQGQSLGVTSGTMICEARIGAVPIDPVPLWRGQYDALKNV